MPGSNFLRTFMKHFTNLTSSQQKEVERALSDAQISKELTNLEASVSLLKRKVDQRLPIPQPVSNPTIRGAILEWPALPDQRISFYEIDVTIESNFSTFDTFPTFGTSIVVDGLTETNFVRVRGVRRDGTTTPYSAVIPVIPTLFDITARTQEAFYVKIEQGDPQVVLGGPNSVLDYTPINPDGNSMVWGMLSMYGDPAVAMFGLTQIVASVIVRTKNSEGQTLLEGTEWRNSFGEFWESQAIGPFIVNHPDLNDNVEVRLVVEDSTFYADGSPRETATEVYWAHLNVLELGV